MDNRMKFTSLLFVIIILNLNSSPLKAEYVCAPVDSQEEAERVCPGACNSPGSEWGGLWKKGDKDDPTCSEGFCGCVGIER